MSGPTLSTAEIHRHVVRSLDDLIAAGYSLGDACVVYARRHHTSVVKVQNLYEWLVPTCPDVIPETVSLP